MTNAVMFTAIPNGVLRSDANGTVLSVSIYVTPQLGAGLLRDTPFVDWPSVAAGLTSFTVQANGTSSTSPQFTATLDPNPKYATNRFDSALWRALFWQGATSASAVTMATNAWSVPDHSSSGLLSYGAQGVSAAVKSMYAAVARSPSKPQIGGNDELTKRTREISSFVKQGSTIGNRVKTGVGGPRPSLSGEAAKAVLPPQPQYAENTELARAAAFHNFENYRGINPGAAGTTNAIQADFHQIVGQLADHPILLRRLGLVIDVTFTMTAQTALGRYASIFVQPATGLAGLGGLTVNHPWTFCVLQTSAPAAFRPLYGDSEAAPGYGDKRLADPMVDPTGVLRLDDPQVLHVDDLDLDHAALHVAHYAGKATDDLAAANANNQATAEVTLPALRTSGLSVHHQNREARLGLRFSDTAGWNPNGATFVAENLIRGYRVDVRANGGKWQSLCLRNATFTFSGGPGAITFSDEGYVKAASMTSANGDPVYNLKESLFHWDGWSLVASRPGLVVGPTIAGTQQPPTLPASSGDTLKLPFTTTIAPQPNSLTKLRFGSSYSFRIRAVDLAGNDMIGATTGTPADHASPDTRFTRYEPVSPPVLQLRRAVGEGESLEHLVIRSDPYATPAVFAADWATKNNVPTQMGMNLYAATCERHVAPPKVSVQLAEYHGAFETALANVAPADRLNTSWAIACKEDGSFYDKFVTDSTTKQYRTAQQSGRAIVTPPGSLPDLNLAKASGQPVFTGTDEISPRGTALIQGQYVVFDADTVMLPYLPDPNANGVALVRSDMTGSAPLYRTFGARANVWPELSTFRLVLQESRDALRYDGLDPAGASSTPLTVSLPAATTIELTYCSTIKDPSLHAFGPAAGDPAYANAQNGAYPSLSPRRKITLVHAVQRPAPPGLSPGDIGVLPRNEGETSQQVNATINFDGPSSGRVDLVASWDEYVDAPAVADKDPSTNPIAHSGVVHSFTPDVKEMQRYAAVRQLFGDTKRRDITFSTVATTRFREYFPQSITSNTDNITNKRSLPTKIVCKSSARPPVPKVLYAVPSFLFDSKTTGNTTVSRRSGGTVRVYVDRGWFATGTDERLGVVLARNANEMTALARSVSLWGPDPIWFRGSLNTLDTTHVLPATVADIFYDQPLAEGTGSVHVATYVPNFNTTRQLWYFDIGLSPDNAYFPFLRLALARYQPESVGTLNMSRVALTDFVQLPANRAATVVDQGSGYYLVTVEGPTAPNAPSLQLQYGAAGPASGHTVTVEFQQATTQSPDAIDWVTLGAPIQLSPSKLSTDNSSVAYQQQVQFPSSLAAPGAQFRLLIKEYEVYAADAQDGVRQGVGLVQIGQVATSYATRLVYADAVTIHS